MTTMSIDELEQHLREVLERVRNGEHVLIASDGETVAELSPCDWRAKLEKAFPGMQHATKHMRDIHIERVPLGPGPDIVDVLAEVRADRDFLP